jgi:hypothetical protein
MRGAEGSFSLTGGAVILVRNAGYAPKKSYRPNTWQILFEKWYDTGRSPISRRRTPTMVIATGQLLNLHRV